MAKDGQSRDQKRRAKLAKRREKSQAAQSLAYMGEKYKTEELMHVWLATEIGIYESFVISEKALRDQTAVDAIERLIGDLRMGKTPAASDETHYEVGMEEDLVVARILSNWQHRFTEDRRRPPLDKLVGVLRTILGSIEKVRAPGPQSQSYMHHVAGFLTKNLGVSVQHVSADLKPLPAPEEDELVQIGRRWLESNDDEAGDRFQELVGRLMAGGEANRVLDACHLLIGEVNDQSSPCVAELTALVERGRGALVAAIN